MTDVRYTDYEWIRDDPQLFDEGFGLTVFSPANIDDVLAGMSPIAASSTGDLENLTDIADDQNHRFALIVGLLQIGGAVILYEPYGSLDDAVKIALSSGRTVVSIDGNPAVSYFQLFRDGSTITGFEKMFAYDRVGDEPDALLPLMEQIGGFDLGDETDEELSDVGNYHSASLALSEAVTGVRLSLSLLTETQYRIYRFARPSKEDPWDA